MIKVMDIRTRELEALIEDRRYARAERLAKEMLHEQGADKMGIYSNLREMYCKQERYNKAQKAAKKAVKCVPEEADNWYQLFHAQRQLYRQREEGFTASYYWRLSRRWKRWDVGKVVLRGLSPILLPVAVLGSVRAATTRRKAISSLEEAIQRDPKREYYLDLLHFANEPKKAISYGEQALKQYPDDAELCALLSTAYQHARKIGDSYALMMKAVRLRFTDAEFIRQHFFSRLGEKVDKKSPTPLYELFTEAEDVNWENKEMIQLVLDFFERYYPLDYRIKPKMREVYDLFFQAKLDATQPPKRLKTIN